MWRFPESRSEVFGSSPAVTVFALVKDPRDKTGHSQLPMRAALEPSWRGCTHGSKLVGAGGIGWELYFAIIRFKFGEAATAIIMILILITAIDRFCQFLRHKII